MPNSNLKNKPLNMKPAARLFLIFALVISLAAVGCRNADQQVNQTDQPVMTNSFEHFIKLPLCRQATDYTCGAAALQSILYYYGNEYDEGTLAADLKSDPDLGTNYRNIMDFAEAQGLQAESRTDMTINDLEADVRAGKPVIVALQAWSENPDTYSDDWNDGHYAVVVGYDNNRIYFMDPLQLGNYTYIITSEFLARWHDTDNDNVTVLNHFGVVIWGDKSGYDPSIVIALG